MPEVHPLVVLQTVQSNWIIQPDPLYNQYIFLVGNRLRVRIHWGNLFLLMLFLLIQIRKRSELCKHYIFLTLALIVMHM